MTMQGTWEDARELGHKKGLIEARAGAVLEVLRVRGIPVPEDVHQRILAQKDPERLARWHERAILASSADEVIDEPS